ncbi:4-hydroxy-3-methylbut-2-enyl diphosphate reductase [Actinoplanes sp. GCM10030250]|uniref:4-hydroxy-3-methylbut-2-enyl diphosphate reductase n=1 Tax=Actinoplanes sp. GCM10030250 TaxID=3273376 RepID=UPI0036212DDB
MEDQVLSRTVVLAAPRSFCAGVDRAIDMVEQAVRLHGAPVYVRRRIVHDAHVIARLEELGAIFVEELDTVPDDAIVVFSAHGVAPTVRVEASRRRLNVIDATCPLVAKVHSDARRFTNRGDTVLLIGRAGHEEVEGTLGQVPGRIRLVQDVSEAGEVEVADPERVAYLTQTTLAPEETGPVADALRERFPELSGPGTDDICYATTNRQEAVAVVAAECEVVLVVGTADSQRLVEVARRSGTPAYLVEDGAGVHPRWLSGVRTVGLTAGASTPPHLVVDVIDTLAGLGPIRIAERRTTEENITFMLPPALRPT